MDSLRILGPGFIHNQLHAWRVLFMSAFHAYLTRVSCFSHHHPSDPLHASRILIRRTFRIQAVMYRRLGVVVVSTGEISRQLFRRTKDAGAAMTRQRDTRPALFQTLLKSRNKSTLLGVLSRQDTHRAADVSLQDAVFAATSERLSGGRQGWSRGRSLCILHAQRREGNVRDCQTRLHPLLFWHA